MNILTLDFETYFDNDYSLSKMTTEAYIRDPRFAAHGVGLRHWDGSSVWLDDDEFRTLLKWQEWAFHPAQDDVAVLCHHAQFDGLILSHHYGVIPTRWLDTMSMARYLWPGDIAKLDFIARRFALPPKNVPYDKFRGSHWPEIPPGVQREIADGCLHDCEITYTIFQRMMSGDY